MLQQIPNPQHPHHHLHPPNPRHGAAEAPSFISRLQGSITRGLPSAEPVPALRADEPELVRGVLRALQGHPTSLFRWDARSRAFSLEDGVHVPHLSHAALRGLLGRFLFGARCLKLVEVFVNRVGEIREGSPTLRAFAGCISSWLTALRWEVLKLEEEKVAGGSKERPAAPLTLLGIGDSLSSICARAEYLLHIVHGSVPDTWLECQSVISAAEFAVHILDHLFLKLNEICLVQGGEEKAYHMLLTIFTGSLLPYLEVLDSWIYDGTLDDPYEELFFFANKLISVEQPEFWEKSYLVRRYNRCSHNNSVAQVSDELDIRDEKFEKPPATHSSVRRILPNGDDVILCPLFLKGVAKAMISAGKSLQLVRHAWGDPSTAFTEGNACKLDLSRSSIYPSHLHIGTQITDSGFLYSNSFMSEDVESKPDDSTNLSAGKHNKMNYFWRLRVLNLPEFFLISLVGLVDDGIHLHEYFPYAFLSCQEILEICKAYVEHKSENNEKTHKDVWLSFMVDTIVKQSGCLEMDESSLSSTVGLDACSISATKEALDTINFHLGKRTLNDDSEKSSKLPLHSFYPENPAITVCKDFLLKTAGFWDELNLSGSSRLPPLNDETIRKAIFGQASSNTSNELDQLSGSTTTLSEGTDFCLGYRSHQFGEFQLQKVIKSLEILYPFPTLLPCLQEKLPVSGLIPIQKNGTLATQVLNWLQGNKSSSMLLPSVILQESLIVYIRRQVDFVGSRILMKLLHDWKLMGELNILRSIYLLGSGDLLQQFLIVIFDKVDKGDSLDDEFELNTVLQESIRNSVDGTIISAPESLSISILKQDISDNKDIATGIKSNHKVFKHAYGIDALDPVKFTYKVSWPLDLIISKEAIKKYNQVLNFLLKVKRAKFVLDKARRWMWKFRGTMTCSRKHRLLVEQKLLHFVDAFHQYVMDKVLHSSWLEVCSGMTSASSLDEVIDVHEAYLLSIQRQCFVASDKLWILIASRVKVILGLALDFYTIQQTLSTGAAPAIKARCEMEVNRIEKEFDECIAFLLRIMSFKLNVGHFPHLADFVTRINYNYFYMSADGNLLTIPTFESSGAKLVKTVPREI